MYGKYLMDKKQAKRQSRIQRQKEAEELGHDVESAKQTPKTLENTREKEHTMVRPDDDEVMGDEASDEFADYFSGELRPKILVTTRPRPSAQLFHFIGDLMRFFPKLYYYPRKSFSVKEICEFATRKDFTHLMVLGEKSKVCNGMIISHLRRTNAAATGAGAEDEGDGVFKGAGPTAFFKVSNVITSTDVPNHGSATSHVPELILNGFGTRLGHRVGRFLGSLFPHNAQFQGRQAVTFHNQRDYIFVRHHRYIFEEGKEDYKDPNEKAETKADEGGVDEDEDEDPDEDEEERPKKKAKKVKKKNKDETSRTWPK